MSRPSRLGALALAVFSVTALLGAGAFAGAAASADDPTAALAGDDGRTAALGPAAGDDVVAQTDRQIRGSPALRLFASQRTVPSGAESTVTLDILNTGEMVFGNQLDSRVTTARGLTLEIDDGDVPIEVEDGPVVVGDVRTDASPVQVPLDVTVPDDVPDGEYEVEVTADYRYTFEIVPEFNDHKDRDGTDRFDVTIVVDDGARFAIVETDTDAQVGGGGDVTATLRNVGDEVARDAVVTGTSTGSAAVIGDGSADAFVGDWAPGSNRTVTFDSTVSPSFGGGAYALVTSVDYRDADGIEAASPTSRAGVVPFPEQSFSIDDVEGTLEVGYSGTVSGTLTNEGPLDVDEAVLVANSQSDRVTVGERRYALPAIPAGESVEFSFDADVSGSAAPGPRQFTFTTEYTNGDATIAVDERRRIEVAPRQPEFSLTADNVTVPAGETRQVTFRITNQRPETLSSINAGLYADSPLSAPNDEAFVDELAPGESEEITFEVAAASGASVETHPIELDFRYDDERGNDRISDVTQYPVAVTEPTDDGGFPLVPIGVGLLVVVAGAGAVVLYRRR
ncbi:COG1361 S-layer family protein [Halorubrum sp. HHNYT27]|uniref:COG1361 S-layer family protein n=1 Tax=Halorubrum sp. HHNYT27 TaxID=3402275 RepID=UPI003EBB1035